ncbi:hypothetical protein DFJ74DRAFT_612137, partial [Hyaloraphidium curvatum]
MASVYSGVAPHVVALGKKIKGHIRAIQSRVSGSNAARKGLERNMRAYIHFLGLPAFFGTVNPSEIYNPMMDLMAGFEVKWGDHSTFKSSSDRAFMAARWPATTARFFHYLVNTFIDTLLMPKDGGVGVLGKATGVFGTYE